MGKFATRKLRPSTSTLAHPAAALFLGAAAVAIPGLGALAVWPALFVLPGWALARRVFGLERPLAGLLAVPLSLVVSPIVCLPPIVFAGGPRPWAIACALALLAALLAWPRTPRFAIAAPTVPLPPKWLVFVVLALALARIVESFCVPPLSDNLDFAYLTGLVRGLADAFPAPTYAAALYRVRQPFGYWLLYAVAATTTQRPIGFTLGIASSVLLVGFEGLLWTVTSTLSRDRRAAPIATILALGGAELGWVLDGQLIAHGDRTSFGVNLFDGFYNAPALILVLLAFYFVAIASAHRDPRAWWVALTVFIVLPFFHPVYAMIALLAAGLTACWEVGRRRLTIAQGLALAIPPALFWLVFVKVYARTLHAPAPFVFDYDELWDVVVFRWEIRAVKLARYAALLVPFAVYARVRGPWLAMASVCAILTVFASNPAQNYHWTYDPFIVALLPFAADGVARLWRERPRLGLVVLVLVLLDAVATSRFPRRISLAFRRESSPEDEARRELGAWLATNTSRRATIAIPERDKALVGIVEGLAERRLFLGWRFELANVLSEETLATLARENAEVLAAPMSPLAEERCIAYVVLPTPRPTLTPLFANAAGAVYRAAGDAPCPLR